MKHILFATILFLISCHSPESKRRTPNKYKMYDVVYLLPDSTRAVITDTTKRQEDLRYRIGVSTLNGYKFYDITEEMIISK